MSSGMTSKLSEFELIERYFNQLGQLDAQVALGVGDDCAVIDLSSSKQLCLSIDTAVEGIHFPKHCSPQYIAQRALGAALSDLAAMGAEPSHFTLALTLPESDEPWLASFAKGLSKTANQYGVQLVGGDTTRGSLCVSVQVHGFVEKGGALYRSGAKPGDIIAVTGTLGDAGAALNLLEKSGCSEEEEYLLSRYYQPEPRMVEGKLLRSLASACIDVSDGLLADAEHIAKASGCQLLIDQESLPISDALMTLYPEQASMYAQSAGDDYELLFTLSETDWQRLTELRANQPSAVPVSRIGVVAAGQSVQLRNDGEDIPHPKKGYQHFE